MSLRDKIVRHNFERMKCGLKGERQDAWNNQQRRGNPQNLAYSLKHGT
ncbi:MAG: hypothetical protein WBO73_10445 [Gammaproteobacteria bacterium]